MERKIGHGPTITMCKSLAANSISWKRVDCHSSQDVLLGEVWILLDSR